MSASEPLTLTEQCDLARCTLHRAPDQLPRLVEGPLGELGALLFLLDERTDRFIRQEAPRLASLLRRRSERVAVAQNGRIRGRIDWPATTKAQMEASHVYICRTSRPDYDQPENQYFLFVLHILLRCVHRIGLEEHPLCWGEQAQPILGILAARRGSWELIQRIMPTGGITLPGQVTPAHERAVQQARLLEYQALPEIWTLYRRYILQPEIAVWQKALEVTMPYSVRWTTYHQ